MTLPKALGAVDTQQHNRKAQNARNQARSHWTTQSVKKEEFTVSDYLCREIADIMMSGWQLPVQTEVIGAYMRQS